MTPRTTALLVAALAIAGAVVAARLARMPAAAPRPATPVARVIRLGPQAWKVPRALRDAYLDDRERVSREIRLKPVLGTEPDALTEIRIDRAEAGTPAFEAGFRKGDRILRVNGTPVVTLGRAVNLIHEIRDSSRLNVQVDREGRILEFSIEFE